MTLLFEDELSFFHIALKGLKGDKGDDGKKGDRGDNGSKGDRGDNGNKGDRGSTGMLK